MKKFYVLLFFAWFFLVQASATILTVPGSYSTIQSAINASNNGDTILVAPGTYYEHLNTGGSNVVLGSWYLTTADPSYIGTTVIDGSQSGRVLTIHSVEDSTCRIVGFTIRNGNGAFESGTTGGGGILIENTSPVVEHCIVENCSAPAFGGGVSITGSVSGAKMRNSTIRNNTADHSGGGLFMGDCSPDAVVENCIISGNSISCACDFNGGGGGVNITHRGKLVNCLVTGNSAPNALAGGGGVYCDWGNYYGSQGIFIIGSTIAHNTALEHGGTGYVIDGGDYRNCIIYGNTNGNNGVSNTNGGYYYSCCSDQLPMGGGNISGDPLFVSPALGNFRLTSGSPCINAGNNYFNESSTDLDGNPRIAGVVDMGAYELGSGQSYTVQVGDDFFMTDVLPVFSCDDYNYSQQIYLDYEISGGGGGPGYITKLRFYYYYGSYSPESWNQWTVYLGNTTKTDFLNANDWVPVSSMSQVFSGTIPQPAEYSWLEIVFDSPFYYTGQNLVVAIHENASGSDCYANWASYGAGTDRGLLYSSYYDDPDPASPPTANWFYLSEIAQIQLDFSQSIGALEGFVYREPSCTQPEAGITVTNGSNSTVTDPNGYYFLELPAGNYTITFMNELETHSVSPVFISGNDTTALNFCLPLYLPPPVQLEAELQGAFSDTVHLTWKAPGSIADQWLRWDNGIVGGSLGYGINNITFEVAARWPVEDIEPYGGAYLKKVRFYPTEATALYTVKVYKGADASVLLYSQPVSNLDINAWNEIDLTTPILIDGTSEFWIGYHVSQTEGYPVGMAAGPAVPLKGDMFKWGASWVSVKNTFGIDNNWLLQGFISEDTLPFSPVFAIGAEIPETPSEQMVGNSMLVPQVRPVQQGNPQLRNANPHPNHATEKVPKAPSATSLTLVGYNLYRNNVLLADSLPGLSYTDPALPKGSYEYKVTALYEEGESGPDDPVNVHIYTCFPPTGLTVPNHLLTTTSARVEWTASAISSSAEWLLEWGTSGFVPGTGNQEVVAGIPVFDLTTLSPGSEYDVYVMTMCSSSDSSARVMKRFRTHWFDCPLSASPENEICGDTINNGCTLAMPTFDTAFCGDTVCGTAWLYKQSRDTDWYVLQINDTTDVTMTFKAEFSCQAGIKNSPCPSNDFLVSSGLWPGWQTSLFRQFIPGTYYIYFTPTYNGDVNCDSLNRYWFHLYCNDCLGPDNLAATSLGSSSAQLSWSSGNSSWDVKYGEYGFSSGTQISGVADNTLIINDLSSGTLYEFYVRSNCGGGSYSAWSGPHSFYIPCEPYSIPYYEDFTYSAVGSNPYCWEWSGDGVPGNWSVEYSSTAGGGGAPELTFVPWQSYFSGVSRIISPEFDASHYGEIYLSFNYYMDIANSNSYAEVAITNDGVTWTQVWSNENTGITGPDYAYIFIDNTALDYEHFRFAFIVNGNSWDINTWSIDDISLDGFYWDGGLEGYVTDCLTTDLLSGVQVVVGEDTTMTDSYGYYNISPLPPGYYDVTYSLPGYSPEVITNVWIDTYYTTWNDACLYPIVTPENRTVQDVTVSNGSMECYDALQTITVAGGGTSFTVQPGGEATFIAGQQVNYLPGTLVQSGGYMLGRIAPGGPFCGENESPIVMADIPGPDVFVNQQDIRIYPNPATGKARLVISSGIDMVNGMVEVYNFSGSRVLIANTGSDREPEIDLSAEPAGIYLVRLITEGKVFSTRLVRIN